MTGRLDIPGGPVDIQLVGVGDEGGLTFGWWRMGARRLQVRLHEDGLWRLTGHGHDVKPAYRGDLPPVVVRRAFRERLRAWLAEGRIEGGVCVAYATDYGRLGATRWGWDDYSSWRWHTADMHGQMHAQAAISWMRDQGRAVGVRIIVDAEEGA